MLTKSEWAHLIPHQGAMCLLHEVLAWDDERIHANAVSHLDADNPLRRGGILRAVHLCEYGAQAMALHGGLLAQRAGVVAAPGLLVSLREVKLRVASADAGSEPLIIYANKLLGDHLSWQYVFRIDCAGRCLASGRAAVMHAARPHQAAP
jgi:predicted hotdog family 3-hydroxylacyl-ACP dehydratase